MKKFASFIFFSIILIFSSCNNESGDLSPTDPSTDFSSESGGSSGGGDGQGQAGLITAGEWNDLNNWQFWNDLLNGQEYSKMSAYWSFYGNNRLSFQINTNNQPYINATLELFKNGALVWESKTDNFGKAEMWIDLFQLNESVNSSEYSLAINGQQISIDLKLYNEGVNQINVNINQSSQNRVELAFIVDATGSMSDELEFLKDDLEDVIQKIENENSSLEVYTSSVFYRDVGDEYVVKKSEFSGSLSSTINFINEQSAGGGGDFPEAVHTALKMGIEELQWSENAKTRIAFLLLDAPPHYDAQIIGDLQNSIRNAAKKGIKIIPITASGIDKETEFLMRYFSISTNGTYVFITNDSGIGNDHLEPSVGQYEVEQLNDLMVRLIKKYTE